MKKSIAFILALAAVSALTACGAEEESSLLVSEEPTLPAAEFSTIDDVISYAEEELEIGESLAEIEAEAEQGIGFEQIQFIDAATGTDNISGHIVDIYSDAVKYILDDSGNVYLYERDFSADDTYNVTLVAENTELTAINFAYHSVLTILTQEQGGYLFCDDSHVYDGSKKLEMFDDLHGLFMHQSTVQAIFYGVDGSGNLRAGAYTNVSGAEKELCEVKLDTSYDITGIRDIAGNGCCIDSNGGLIDFNKTRFVAQGPCVDGKLETFQSMGGEEDIVYLEYEKNPVRVFPAHILTSNDETSLVMNDDNSFDIVGTSVNYDTYSNVDLASVSGDIVKVYPIHKKTLVIETTDGYYSWSEKKGTVRIEQLDGHKALNFYDSGYDAAVILEDGKAYSCNEIL